MSPRFRVMALGGPTVVCLGTHPAGLVVVSEDHVPWATFETTERESIACWGQVPTMFAFAMDHPGVACTGLSLLHHVARSGAAMPCDLVARLAELPLARCTSYGMTETTGSVTCTDPDADVDTLAVTIGRPEAGSEVRSAHEHGREIPGAEPGELQVRGDRVMLGSLNRSEDTAEVFDAEDWLRTGQLARRRDDGNLVVVGRTRERFTSGGLVVSPCEVEQVREADPQVTPAMDVAVPDEPPLLAVGTVDRADSWVRIVGGPA